MIQFHPNGLKLQKQPKNLHSPQLDLVVIDKLQVIVQEHECGLLNIRWNLLKGLDLRPVLNEGLCLILVFRGGKQTKVDITDLFVMVLVEVLCDVGFNVH